TTGLCPGFLSHCRQCRLYSMAQTCHGLVDALKRTGWLFAGQPEDGFGHPEINNGNECQGDQGAKVEHRKPVVETQQPGSNGATQHTANGIADGHDGDGHVTASVIGELCRHRVDRCQHTAYTKTGKNTP